MQPRLERRYGRLIYPEGISVKSLKEKKTDFIKDLFEYIENGNVADEEVEYIEDCFDDMERPRFGWRVKVKLKEDESCDINFENPDQTTCDVGSKTENEELDELNSRHWNFFAESRQTDEGFRSAAPSDCRINLC